MTGPVKNQFWTKYFFTFTFIGLIDMSLLPWFSLAQYPEKLCLSMTCEWEWDLVLVTDKIKIPGPRSAVGQWIRCFRWNTAKIEDLRQKNTSKIHQESSDHPDSTDSTPNYRSHKININQPLKKCIWLLSLFGVGCPPRGRLAQGLTLLLATCSIFLAARTMLGPIAGPGGTVFALLVLILLALIGAA